MSEVNGQKIICKQCEREFVLTEEDAKKFLDKGLELPKRCYKCRKENKLNQKIRDEVTRQIDVLKSELGLNK